MSEGVGAIENGVGGTGVVLFLLGVGLLFWRLVEHLHLTFGYYAVAIAFIIFGFLLIVVAIVGGAIMRTSL